MLEEAEEVVVNAELKLGSHLYTSNWIVADFRYDILFGMPWHVQHLPITDYKTCTVRVGENMLPKTRKSEGSVKIQNMGVKKFRSLFRKKKRNSDDLFSKSGKLITSRQL